MPRVTATEFKNNVGAFSSESKWMARGDVEVIHEGVIEIGGGAHGLRDPRDLIRHDMAGQAPYDL